MMMLAATTVYAFDSTPYPGPNAPDGSATYPWKIDLPEDFDAIGTDGTHLSDHHYVVTRNLDFGNQDHRIRVDFAGILDGGYHTISNIHVDQPAEMSVGLISANMVSGSVVRRIGIVSSYFRANDAAGTIAASMQAGSLLEECYAQGNTVISIWGNGTGGIVGGSSASRPAAILRNSYARDNSVSSGHQTVGGICGYHDALVERCYSAGNTLTAPRENVGGLVGYAWSGIIIDSYSDRSNIPSVQVGYMSTSSSASWQNALVPYRYTSDFDITPYSIVELNWDPAIWTKGADNYPRLAGFDQPTVAPVARCRNVTVAADTSCQATASINDGSFDPDPGDTLTLSQNPPGPYPPGDTLVTLTVTDNHGASSSCTATVTVTDTTPPTLAGCPPPTASYLSLAEMPVPPTVTASDNCDASVVVSFSETQSNPGMSTNNIITRTWQAADASGNPASCTQVISVNVVESPHIVEQPQSRTNDVGTAASFTVTVTPDMGLTYQWQFNSADIPGATAQTYALPSVHFLHAGDYRVVVASAGGSVTSEVATLTVTPGPGIALWLRADAGTTLNGSAISQWNDQSGNSRHANQALSGAQPAMISSAVNGLPAIRFDGADDFMTFDLPVNGLNGMTIFLVAANRQDQNAGTSKAECAAIFWNETVYWGTVYLSPFQSCVAMRFGTLQTDNRIVCARSVPVGNLFTLSTAVKAGTTDSLYVNRALVASESGKLPAIAGCRPTGNLGRGYNDNTFYNGDLAEVLVYTRALTETERQAIEEYLDTKYRVSAGLLPEITRQPADLTVEDPVAATLGVEAQHAWPLSYQWRRDGVPIAGATSPVYVLVPTSHASDNGAQFDVVVANAFGAVTSRLATLTVTLRPDGGYIVGDGSAITNIQATNIVGTLQSDNFEGEYNRPVILSNTNNVIVATVQGNIGGSGATLTNLQTTNLVGKIPDSLLSSNVALLNTEQVFSGVNSFTNPANLFVGTLIGTLVGGVDGTQVSNVPMANVTGTLGAGQLGGSYSNRLDFGNPSNCYSGSGTNLTSLNAGSLVTGTVPDARLSANVALLDQSQTFSGTNNFTNAANVFAGTFKGTLVGGVDGTQVSNVPMANVTGTLGAGQLGGSYSNRLDFSNPSNNYSGSGTNLTSLNADSLVTGTVPDARLSSNVAFLDRDQTFSGANTFSDVNNIFAGSFHGVVTGDGAGMTNLPSSSLTGTIPTARLPANVALLDGSPTFTGTVSAPAFAGSGTALSNLDAAMLASGILPDARLAGSYSSLVSFVHPMNYYVGTFVGDGSGLTNLATGTISNVWQLTGNAGTTPAMHFLGTVDSAPLELRVHNQRALRIEPGGTGTPPEAPNWIGGSSGNTVAGGVLGATIGGGGDDALMPPPHHRIDSDFATVGGGRLNTIADLSRAATIAGGERNRIESSAPNAMIGGGWMNTNNSSYATIGGGQRNWIQSDAQNATVAGGTGNTVQSMARAATIGGGEQNSIFYEARYVTIGGGFSNRVMGAQARAAVVAGGEQNSIQGGSRATISGGFSNVVTGDAPFATIPGGTGARADKHGQLAYAGGSFNFPGDAQSSLYILRGTSSDTGGWGELFLDGAGRRLTIPPHSTWAFDILLVGRSPTGGSAGYRLQGVTQNASGATSFVGTPQTTVLGESHPAWDAGVFAEGDALIIRATGGSDIRWVATVHTAEVSD